jgi:RNA polymerase sigma-70 factor (ECF subfamily)
VSPPGRRLSQKIPPVERSSDVQAARSEELQPGDGREPAGVSELARRILTEQLPVLRAVARNLVRNAAEVEDLVQDVFEKALRSLHRLDLDANPRGWMVTILHNLHIDRCRQRARMQPHVSCDDAAIAMPVSPDDGDAPIWSAITTDDVRRAAAQLPDELREVYVMFALEGRSYIDVAAALGIPKATVGTRLSRARARLKQLLTAELAAPDREARR